MRSIFSFFVENWRFSFVLLLMFIVVGGLGSVQMRRETFPPVNFAVVLVNTVYPGASPQEVYDRVTKPIEDELRGLSGIKDVRSTSQSERSEINIRIDIDGTNVSQVVTDIQRAVQRSASQLPAEILDVPLVSEIKAEEIPILEIGVTGTNSGRAREKISESLQELLEDAPGVSTVRFSGYRKREIQVLLDTQKLAARQVGLQEVTEALSSQLKDIPAGFLRTPDKIQLVRIMGKTTRAEDVANIAVRTNEEGSSVRVRDLGRVVDGTEKDTVLTRLNGEEATLLIVTKKAEADAVTTIQALRERITQFEKTMGPDHKLLVYNDEGARVENRLEIVEFNAVAGLIVVLLVLFLFLPGKVGLASALSLPVCTLMTLTVMVLVGANFNVITMMALIICLGNLVDNSVVVSEYYTSLREQGLAAREAAVESAQKFFVPFTASTVTIVAAFVPMLVTRGVLGQFIQWIPVVVTIALFASLIEALTLLPARLQFLNVSKRPVAHQGETDLEHVSQGWFGRVELAWGRVVEWTVQRRWATLSLLSGLIVSGFVVTAAFNRFELFPSEGDEFYVLRFDLPTDSSIEATHEVAGKLSREVERVLGKETLRAVIARAGVQQTDPSDPTSKTGEHVGIIIAAIKPEVAPGLNIKDTLAKLRSIEAFPPIQRLVAETVANGPPVGKPLTLTLRSSNYTELRTAIDALKAEIAKVPGVMNLEDDEVLGGPEYRFVPQNTFVKQAGLSLESIGFNLRTALEGFAVADLVETGRDFEIRVRLGDEDRTSVAQIQDSQVLNRSGNLVPLSRVGSLEPGEPTRVIKNFDYKQAIAVTAEVDVTKITALELNKIARDFVEKKLQVQYPSLSAVYGGEEEATNDSLESLGIALILAVFLIFATLVFTFKSFSSPLLILSTIPLGLVGVFYAFALDQRPLSFLAFIGVVGLTGVVINSAIILVDYIEELRRDPRWSSLPLQRLLVLAARRRLRAVLATGLTTIVGLLPTAFGLGGYDPILVPMTLALSWGMIVGTVLSLLWIPAGYQVLQEFRAVVFKAIRRFVPNL